MGPQFVEQMIAAGANVDISGQSYPPDFVTKWVALAKDKGVHLTIGGHYGPDNYQQWATLGGSNVTLRL